MTTIFSKQCIEAYDQTRLHILWNFLLVSIFIIFLYFQRNKCHSLLGTRIDSCLSSEFITSIYCETLLCWWTSQAYIFNPREPYFCVSFTFKHTWCSIPLRAKKRKAKLSFNPFPHLIHAFQVAFQSQARLLRWRSTPLSSLPATHVACTPSFLFRLFL